MKALVTGGGGFLGGAIVRQLLARGDQVRSLARSAYPQLQRLGVEQTQADIADAKAIAGALKGCDIVFHVAAKAGVGGPYRNYYRPNVLGTHNLLEECRRQGIRRLVYTSSPSVVFGKHGVAGVDESAPYPKSYEAHYPKTKAIAEQLVLRANGPDLATVALRPHVIWGPGDNHLIPRILAQAREGRLRRIGRGNPLIDGVYVDNAAQAHLLAADRLFPGSPVAGKAYFIAQGEPVPIWDLMNQILHAVGLPPITRTVPEGFAHVASWMVELAYNLFAPEREPPLSRFVTRQLTTPHWFNLDAARRDLAYQPGVTMAEGLRRLTLHFENSL